MKTQHLFKGLTIVALWAMIATPVWATKKSDTDTPGGPFKTYEGKITDAETNQALVFASIGIKGTNIATVSNTEGTFSIKVPEENLNADLEVSYIGYETGFFKITDLKTDKPNHLKLKVVSVNITEINVIPNNPRLIIEKVMENKLKNYSTDPLLMKAFYRETIKKKKAYVGISEAVVQVLKASYAIERDDQVRMLKGRKSADVEKMDTLLFKLQGGPYSTLLLDVVKDPYYILDPEIIDSYDYTYLNITKIDGRLYYVIEYKQKSHINNPLYYGRLYVDVDTYAISSITFSLNTENKNEVAAMFIKKKPLGVKVEPTRADYMVQYKERNGKWYYSYSRGEVNFKVKWDKKVFNNNYTTMVEMAITDWEPAENKPFKPSDRLKMNVIMDEAVTGFNDAGFWGEYNTIEPEQSIQSAIKKISKNLEKAE